MTEEEWMACGDPGRMLEFLRGKTSDRKLRLLAVACCERMFESIGADSRGETALEVAERFADGNATLPELEEAWEESDPDFVPTYACRQAASPEGGVEPALAAAGDAAYGVAAYLLRIANLPETDPSFSIFHTAERASQAHLVRDIFVNPFRPVSLDESWLTSDVLALARWIYAERAFDRMPILADALQDAGCDSEDVLSHCRDASLTHVRGCWVVDLVLGKE